jgi:hypothetical protein
MKELLISSMNLLGLAWWVEVTTENPVCTYYFGPFESDAIAKEHQAGYIEDLQREGAQNIVATVKRCKPSQLTSPDESSPDLVAMSGTAVG